MITVDVRPPTDFAQSHIQSARDIPASIETAGLPRDAKIILYCSEPDCPLPTKAANRLIANGYTHVSVLEGGMAAWVAKGYPMVMKNPTGKSAKPHWPSITAAEARKRLSSGAQALDVRPALEFSAGHIPGARNVPLETLDSALSSLPKNIELIVYDRRFNRVRTALTKLTAAGIKADALNGGIIAWTKAKYPVEMK